MSGFWGAVGEMKRAFGTLVASLAAAVRKAVLKKAEAVLSVRLQRFLL